MEYWLIFFFLFLSAFFSGSETAFFSLNKIHVKKLEKSKDRSHRRIYRLLKSPRELLITILLGNTVVNVLATATAASITIKLSKTYFPNSGLTELFLAAEIVVMTVALLVFGEITPKLFAFTRSQSFAAASGVVLEILYYILYPIIKLLYFLSCLFSKNDIENNDNNPDVTGEDFRNLIVSDSAINPLGEHEKKIIDGIFRFSSTQAKEIMIPRVDIVAVDVKTEFDDIVQTIIKSGHSRIPVYKKTIDEIIGFVFAKDFILNPDKKTIQKYLRKPCYVPENTNIQTLLNLFRSKRTHLAIIVDEYGGTSGIVTMEDVLEVVVGDITDEYDTETPLITKHKQNEYIISGMCPISVLNSEFGFDIDSETHENIASFLLDNFNHLPRKNESYKYTENIIFTIEQIFSQRIKSIKLRFIDEN